MQTPLNIIREPDEFCEPCGLHKLCKTPVMNGEGSESPTWLFVGEAPGETEDEEGMPFVGKEGAELRQCIEDIGIPLDKCRFTNSVRCRPPDNNIKKFPKAVEHCRAHLLREIRATRPKVVVLIGNNALKSCLNKSGILKMHGQAIDIGRLVYVCMFHPGYLMRNDTPATRRSFLDALRTAKRYGQGKVGGSREKKLEVIVCKDKKTLQECADAIEKSQYPATDTESSTLSPFAVKKKPKLGCVGFSDSPDRAFVIPLRVRFMLDRCNFHWREGLEVVKHLWEYPDLKWICHNGKQEMVWGLAHGIWLGGRGHKTGVYADTMLGSYALDHTKGIHSLKDWGYKVGMSNYERRKVQWNILHPETDPEKGGNLLMVPAEILYDYNGKDCIATRRAFLKQKPMLKERGLWTNPFMFPLMYHHWTSTMMEWEGINMDMEQNGKLSELYTNRIAKLDERLRERGDVRKLQRRMDNRLLEEIYERVTSYKRPPPNVKKKVFELFERQKELINLNSADVKRELIFDILGYESLQDTKSGEPSTERWIIEELYAKEKDPVLKALIERGEYASFKSKYIDPVPGWAGSDGRTHTTYKLHSTATGRPSSENPNHLNLPARSRLTGEIQTQFVSRGPGYFMVKQDSKQIELRLIADAAKDQTMIDEFNAGKDPHKMGAIAANELSDKQWDKLKKEVQKKLRSDAKNAVSFGLVYGREAPALALDFGKSIKWAEKFKFNYFSKYHGIRDWLKLRRKQLLHKGYAKSKHGRIRKEDKVFGESEGLREAAIREMINSPIQGDASDINFIAAYRMAKWLRKKKMKTRVVLFVYDAVYLDAYYKELKQVIPKLREFMTDRNYLRKMTGWKLGVALETDCAVGRSGGPDMIELERRKDMSFIIPEKFTNPFYEDEEKAA